jgi:hypothetical protein
MTFRPYRVFFPGKAQRQKTHIFLFYLFTCLVFILCAFLSVVLFLVFSYIICLHAWVVFTYIFTNILFYILFIFILLLLMTLLADYTKQGMLLFLP